ncbi:MAG: hypothetical protein P8Y61_12775 [Gammaproteobacteria bacterium]|jgi:hypothetical protein
MKTRTRIIYFSFIALIMLSELVTSNLYSLFGNLENTADIMGVTVAEERIRLYILIVLDIVAGGGALLAVTGYVRAGAANLGRIGVTMAAVGMVIYGCYQFWAGTFQLGTESMQNLTRTVGIIYPLIGIGAWFVGRDLRRGTFDNE